MKLQYTGKNGTLDLQFDKERAHVNLDSDTTKFDFTLEWRDIQAVAGLMGDKLDEITFGPPRKPRTTRYMHTLAKVSNVNN